MTTRIYRSTDLLAPALTGEAGSLITLLTACLVDGYGVKSSSGWTKPFATANVAAFRAPLGNRLFLQVNDAGVESGAFGARAAALFGFESMTSATSGIGRFPSTRQIGSASSANPPPVVRKSSTADAVARPWYVVAGESFVYVITEISSTKPMVENDGPSGLSLVSGCFFGDLAGAADDDLFATALIAYDGGERLGAQAAWLDANTGDAPRGHWIARSITGAGPTPFWRASTAVSTGSSVEGNWTKGFNAPDPFSRSFVRHRVTVWEAAGGLQTHRRYSKRGYMPDAFRADVGGFVGFPLGFSLPGDDGRAYVSLPVEISGNAGVMFFAED